jgi:hypothetical protein
MSDILKDFAKSQTNSVEYRYPVGIWPVYTGYELREHGVGGTFYGPGSLRRMPFVEAPYSPDHDPLVLMRNAGHGATHREPAEQESSTPWVYSPLREPGLFIEFARLFDPVNQRIDDDEAAPKVLDWVERHGVLGDYGPYNVMNGEVVSHRSNHRQSVYGFVYHAVRAGKCLGLLEAAKAPDGPHVEKIREVGVLGVRGDTPAQLRWSAERAVDSIVDTYLMRETCLRRYRLDNGTRFRGPSFHSLLGAMYLQMSNFRDASTKDIKFCRWCGDLITFKQSEPPPSDAPKGTRRGKHKTHKNRDFCKEKYGVKDYCKNKWHAENRKKGREGS